MQPDIQEVLVELAGRDSLERQARLDKLDTLESLELLDLLVKLVLWVSRVLPVLRVRLGCLVPLDCKVNLATPDTLERWVEPVVLETPDQRATQDLQVLLVVLEYREQPVHQVLVDFKDHKVCPELLEALDLLAIRAVLEILGHPDPWEYRELQDQSALKVLLASQDIPVQLDR